MPYGQMTALEVAEILGIDARRVEKLAQQHRIPAQRVGGQFRFNRAQITEWLQQEMRTLSHENLADVDAGITAHRQTDPSDAIIIPQLRPDAITVHLHARTRHSVLREMARIAEQTGLLYDRDELLEALEQREELCSTAMEGGIAIPHPRKPLPYSIAEPVLVVANTSQGIGFGAPDGRLSDLFIMTVSPDDRHHLHVLARLCRMLHDHDFVENLRHADTPEEVIDLITQRELTVIADSAT